MNTQFRAHSERAEPGKMTLVLGAALLLAALGGCGEKPQATSARKTDVQAYHGADAAYAAAGWKAGDQVSWEQQMRTRAQSQNEYSRSGAQ